MNSKIVPFEGCFASLGSLTALLLLGLAVFFAGVLVGASRQPAVVVVGHGSGFDDQRSPGVLGWLLGTAAGADGTVRAHSDQDRAERSRVAAETMEKDAALLKLSVSENYRPAGFTESEEDLLLLQRLNSPGLSMPARESVPLQLAIEELSALAKVAIHIDWQSVYDDGVTPQNAVTSHLARRGSAGSLLRGILDGAKSIDSNVSLARYIHYDIRGGQVVVASLSALTSQQVLVFYDVRDLLIIESLTGGPADTPEYRDIGEVKQLIYDAVDANWAETGQGTGKDRIDSFDTFLSVHASPYSHRRISALLVQLRDARRQSP